MSDAIAPRSFSEAAAALAAASAQGRAVRIVGAGTKLGWGGSAPARALQVQLAHLSRVVIDEDASTATVGAGTPLVRAQSMFARGGRMLAIDPQLGLGRAPRATVGGVLATGDSGPLHHRYGPPKAQLLGMTVALSDGRILRTGPRSGHEQDGWDLAALFTGSFGSLGAILAVDVRLRPVPRGTATAVGTTQEPERARTAAEALSADHPELESLDVAWHAGRGGLLAQIAGEQAERRARVVAATMRRAGLTDVLARSDDAGLWARQRAGQRSPDRAVLRVRHARADLPGVLRAADASGAILVGRAALGLSYLVAPAPEVPAIRAALPPGCSSVALDLPAAARGAVDSWGAPVGPELELMRELKRHYDPAGVCNPGIFAGGI